MIHDKLENLTKYPFIGIETLKKIQKFLKEEKGDRSPETFHFNDGSGIFAIFSEVLLKEKNHPDLFIESHRRYIDLQYIILESEVMGHGFLDSFLPLSDYDSEKDFQKWKTDKSFDSSLNFFSVKASEFVLFFPHDAHCPCLKNDNLPNKKFVKKVVLKIPVSFS